MSDQVSDPLATASIESELPFVTNRWSRRVIQPILISLLVTSLAAAFLIIFEIITQTPWRRLWPLVFFVCLEGAYTAQWVARPDQRLVVRPLFRSSELVVILIIARLVSWFVFQNRFPIHELRDYVINPFLLFDGQYLALLMTLFAAWGIVNFLIQLYLNLSIDMAESAYFLAPRQLREQAARPVISDRTLLVADFFRYWMWGGILITVLIALSTFSLNQIVTERIWVLPRLNLRGDMLVTVLVYFLSGFLLISQARLAVLNARWLRGGAHKAVEVERRWHRISIGLLLLVGLGAAFLPIGSTFLLARMIQWGIDAIFFIFSFIAYFFLLLTNYLLSFFEGPAAPVSPTMPPNPLEPIQPPPPSPPPPPPSNAIPLVSIILWVVIIIILVESTLYFLNSRGYRVPPHFLPTVWRALVKAWRALWAGLKKQAGQIAAALPRFERRPKEKLETAPGRRRWDRIRWQKLPPREQVRYFYLATVKKAGEEGVPRQASLTPAEYARRLREEWPEESGDIGALTDAFLEARYMPVPISTEKAENTRSIWQRIKHHLRREQQN